jgi:hypothetical protein
MHSVSIFNWFIPSLIVKNVEFVLSWKFQTFNIFWNKSFHTWITHSILSFNWNQFRKSSSFKMKSSNIHIVERNLNENYCKHSVHRRSVTRWIHPIEALSIFILLSVVAYSVLTYYIIKCNLNTYSAFTTIFYRFHH